MIVAVHVQVYEGTVLLLVLWVAADGCCCSHWLLPGKRRYRFHSRCCSESRLNLVRSKRVTRDLRRLVCKSLAAVLYCSEGLAQGH
ncbi:hypothetical protein PF005_g1414 [Phytophthora fragariae]|uniref:Uncharacterized protein n=1 Tax=Phytophthora fragariae TaxID=53985 RepID=A0A6A3MC73_9STRA|nr:hypothetical protein PF003_g5675 [Phytophthora fragariae]KAE8948935.1 hypothetical protein PF009_g1524 [Phytophthora fragariae]KAE9028367.1 hypothetical protein PF011_g1612 [Phytophthora fragariae]KAE9136056.1 hypothetical protein PF010_g1825 [Phytophthora fragariae]KAE9136353.1 hypothetical protein PF007_g2241 [Phytophthora fragariae]